MSVRILFVGDVVGTGSSRKSATNSVLWFFGDDIDGVPNKKGGGICIGGKVAPIFYNTMEDAGALVFEAPVDELGMGDVETVGGKNASLGEMISHLTASGVQVPGGFATTSLAYRDFLATDGDKRSIDRHPSISPQFEDLFEGRSKCKERLAGACHAHHRNGGHIRIHE